MTFNSHNIVSGQSGPFVLINVCMYVSSANLTTYTILSLFNVHVELAPHLLSP